MSTPRPTTSRRTAVPASTYRLQLRDGVDLERAAQLVPYLAELGIGHLYLSPIFTAYNGSTHGYDVVDPTEIDPVLGGRAGFDRLVLALGEAGLGVLLDIVPNHMRAHADNRWWRDVLEHGTASRWAQIFDLRWRDDLERRLVLPVLGTHYCEALERGELVPGHDAHGFVVRYHEMVAPLDPQTWPTILERAAATSESPAELHALVERCRALPARSAAAREQRAEQGEQLHAELRRVLADPADAAAIDAALRELAGTPGDPASFAPLHALLDEQPWRLAYWRSGLGELNYRRFFDIAELVAVRSEDEAVFAATHALVAELLTSAIPVGLRVDHIDGLADPRGYLRRLRELGAQWVVVEKILGEGESLRGDWATDGTTGYEAAALFARTFVDPRGAARLHDAWRRRHDDIELEQAARLAKLQVLDDSFASALRRLAEDLRRLTSSDRRARDVSLPELERALRELTVALPVYRTYLDPAATGGIDRELLADAARRAAAHLPADATLALEFVERVLRGEPDWTDERAAEVTAFVRRWQQLTSPLAAKGVEDTMLYRWTAIGALAEVGAPMTIPLDPVAELLQGLRQRRRTQRAPLVATATHDTKRGEDSRARLGVLSQLAASWLEVADEAAAALADIGDVPGDRDELELLLQAFVAAWPNEVAEREGFGPRLHELATKAMREAKLHTGWMRPVEDYERSVHARVDALLAGLERTEWGKRLCELQRRVAFFGAHDALGQLVLKLAAPGVCDVYQGTELWDLSLVDPDNRRPVDFDRRTRMLAELTRAWHEDPRTLVAELREHWDDGRIKALVTWRGLQLRREHAQCFLEGELHPVEIVGEIADHVCAFLRHGDGAWVIAVVTRLGARLVDPPEWPIGRRWAGHSLRLPEGAPQQWRDALTGAVLDAHVGALPLDAVLGELPVALLVGA